MTTSFSGIQLQEDPFTCLAVVPGPWLLEHCTPTWRIKDPHKGFQRIVNERRTRVIADSVLAQSRTFPNAIVLATDSKQLTVSNCHVQFPDEIKFLVVDGQHRLWAQRFSDYDADYACVIHPGLEEREMARLFLEINSNQKRVPSSLRWDLVRLVEPDENMADRRAVDLVYSLATEDDSPLFQRIDLTGEQAQIRLKQGSLAPGIKRLIDLRDSPFNEESFDSQYELLKNFFAALREADPEGWRTGDTALYQARVIRALLQLLPKIIKAIAKKPVEVTALDLLTFIGRIDLAELSTEKIRERQGNAGIAAIRRTIEELMFSSE